MLINAPASTTTKTFVVNGKLLGGVIVASAPEIVTLAEVTAMV
jgi:hypothetical protein